jgi:hypothetical protein
MPECLSKKRKTSCETMLLRDVQLTSFNSPPEKSAKGWAVFCPVRNSLLVLSVRAVSLWPESKLARKG